MEKIEREIKANDLYIKGKNDAQIARNLNCCRETIRQWRIKSNLPKNFKYEDHRKINIDRLKELVKLNYTDSQISNILNVSSDGIYGSRRRNNINRKSFATASLVEATQRQKEILIGTLLGDSSLINNDLNPYFSCEHGYKQKDYCYHKFLELESLGMAFKYYKRKTPDLRNGKFYESYRIKSKANPYYLDLYSILYKDKVKKLSKFLFKDFTEVSLAYMFMDDGYKINKTVGISTDCFSKEELTEFIKFLKERFDLNFTIQSRNTIYLKVKDFNKFVQLILPNLHKSMYYKINVINI